MSLLAYVQQKVKQNLQKEREVGGENVEITSRVFIVMSHLQYFNHFKFITVKHTEYLQKQKQRFNY